MTTLEQHVARLVNALEPFAKYAAWVAENHPGWDHDDFEIGLPDRLFAGSSADRLGAFRFARAAIAAVHEREGAASKSFDAFYDALETQLEPSEALKELMSRSPPSPDPAEAMRAGKPRPGVHCWGYGCMFDEECVEYPICKAAEAMRAKTIDECEAIARMMAGKRAHIARAACNHIADAIAALRGKP